MNLKKVKAPLDIEDLKLYFEDKDTRYLIDYCESDLKGEKLLVYLSNLELPCDIQIDNYSEMFELGKAYFNFTQILSVDILEKFAINVLNGYKNLTSIDDELQSFITENQEIIEKWSNRLDSLTLYNMYIIQDETIQDFVKSHTEDKTDDIKGINFVSVLKHEDFYYFYNKIDKTTLKYYSKYFNEYMFSGKNLFYYWSYEKNPMFVLTWAVGEGLLENVSSV